jgi:hypothetical protein
MVPKTSDPLQGLQDRKTQLEAKLLRYKSGKTSAEVTKGDGRQEEAIARVEAHLRQVNTALREGAPKPEPEQPAKGAKVAR